MKINSNTTLKQLLFIALAYFLVVAPLVVFLVQFAWNHTVPEIFNTKEITYWQTFKLLLLIEILIVFPIKLKISSEAK